MIRGKTDSEGSEGEAQQHPEHSQRFKKPFHGNFPDPYTLAVLEGKSTQTELGVKSQRNDPL